MKPPIEDHATLLLAEPRRAENGTGPAAALRTRRRGRPLDMPPEEVLERIRRLAARDTGLFRIHLTEAPLYARARRLFGSWQGAVRAAGFDYLDVLEGSRRRAVLARRSRRANGAVPRGAR
jgi:hypothetical protein